MRHYTPNMLRCKYLEKIMFDDARNFLVGGVNSPVRSCKAVKSTPRFIVKGSGAYVWDSDGNKYIDYIGSFGASIAGHSNPAVLEFVKATIDNGLGFSAPHPYEIELAKLVLERLPAANKIRFVNSGTEAVQTAIRLARGITGRQKIIKFAGCYHGHVDSVLVEAGSGALTLGKPSSPGVVGAEQTIVLEYNNIESIKQIYNEHYSDIAAIIVEPIAGNMGLVLPRDEFLKKLREICDIYSSLLIFDEVMTGLRVHENSAQGLYEIKPDLTTLGKIIGGGLPVGAICGPEKYMNYLAPEGPVYQAGTLSGNPITMASGIATIQQLSHKYDEKLHKHTTQLTKEIKAIADRYFFPLITYNIGGMWGLFLTDQPIYNLTDVQKSNFALFTELYKQLMLNGIYWPPSAYETVFISIMHDEQTLEQTVTAFEKTIKALSKITI